MTRSSFRSAGVSALSRAPLAAALGLALIGFGAHAQEATTAPSSDSRHGRAEHLHAKDLDAIKVTADPFRSAADDLSQPVNVLAGERLDEARASSLGETLQGIPGVQSSNFGPGVGRPIMRGLDGPRVAVMSDGMITQDVSTVSQDHSPAIEPFLADQIEVLKGPSTLLYGNGAIGGAVNVVDGRIAETPVQGVTGRAETRVDFGDKDGQTSMARIDAGNGGLSIHADGVYRNAKDYDTPKGPQANTFQDTKTGSFGASLSGDWGFFGASISRFNDSYGNPGEPGDLAQGERGVHLELHQDRFDVKGGLNDPWGAGSGLRYSFSHTRYDHTEFEGEEVGTSFFKRANEGRVEATFSADSGWQSAVGLQGTDSTFRAVGEESFVPKTDTKSVGLFAVTKNAWGRFSTELGARIDRVKYETDTGLSPDFKPASFSASFGFGLAEGWRLTANLDHSERAPVEEELFADGPHIATLAYEIGDATLDKEKANRAELGLQYSNDWMDAKVSAYYNRYNNFIYVADTGGQWYHEEDDDYLPIRQWTQADATFHGFEGEADFHLAKSDTAGDWDLHVFGDTVRARLNDGGNVPRIPPGRFGAQLRWQATNWRASLGATRYMKQDKLGANETETAGYTMVDAHLAYHIDTGSTAWEVFLDGNNLLDQDARVHTSFLKDDVMLPGRNGTFGVRVFF
ncbi:TonB-dependent receptor [Pseudoxanthomonas sp. UC29_72]